STAADDLLKSNTLDDAQKESIRKIKENADDIIKKSGDNVIPTSSLKTVDEFTAYWNSLTVLPPKTSPRIYTLWRRVNKDWEPAVTHSRQVLNTENRYSKGREAIYFGTSRQVTDAEWLTYNQDYGLRGKVGSKLYNFEVKEFDLL